MLGQSSAGAHNRCALGLSDADLTVDGLTNILYSQVVEDLDHTGVGVHLYIGEVTAAYAGVILAHILIGGKDLVLVALLGSINQIAPGVNHIGLLGGVNSHAVQNYIGYITAPLDSEVLLDALLEQLGAFLGGTAHYIGGTAGEAAYEVLRSYGSVALLDAYLIHLDAQLFRSDHLEGGYSTAAVVMQGNAAANGAAFGYAHIHTGVVRLGRIEAVYMTAQADAHTALVALVLSVELSDLLLAVLPVKLLTAQFQYLTALEVAQVEAGDSSMSPSW